MNKQKIILSIISVFCILLITTSWYFYSQWKKAVTVPSDTTAEEAMEVAEHVANHIQLPEGETPTLATVTDREKLQDQEFFQKAENGDKVLIYSTAAKAILYRPSIDRIIEVAPIFFNNPTSTSSDTSPSVNL